MPSLPGAFCDYRIPVARLLPNGIAAARFSKENSRLTQRIYHTNSQFVRTCLIMNCEQEERASLVELRTNDLIRDFLKIELVKSTISYKI
jgi:hypothetical protein